MSGTSSMAGAFFTDVGWRRLIPWYVFPAEYYCLCAQAKQHNGHHHMEYLSGFDVYRVSGFAGMGVS